MATYPPTLQLPYRVSRAWLEQRTLAGEVVAPFHSLQLQTDQLSPDLRERVALLAKRVRVKMPTDTPHPRVEVIGSGLDPTDHATDETGREIVSVGPVVSRIGELPELAEPSTSAEELLDAYEVWVSRYLDLSLGAIAAWIDRWAVDGEADEDGAAPNGLPITWWRRWVHYRVADKQHQLAIDGRTQLEDFQGAAASSQLYFHAWNSAGQEDMDVALDIVGGPLTLPFVPDAPKELLAARAAHVRRTTDLAFARYWTRQRQRNGFDLEMRRWAAEHGSDRLKMGITDDYRMVPVYLRERIASDAPRFYAHLPKKDDKHAWQPRTGPSEEALRLRRAVQDRLRERAPSGALVASAEIGWMKNAPPAMCDEDHAYEQDEWGNREDLKQSAFEVIVVREWLGRYTLIAGVFTKAEDQPPDYLLLQYVLSPEDYGLEGLPKPPSGYSLAQNAENPFAPGVADDDIPF
jgi:hypothetical protein